MALKIDNLQTTLGTNVIKNGRIVTPGNVSEMFLLPCDGGSWDATACRVVTENVAAAFATSATYTTIPGSTISYMPAPDVKTVIYNFTFSSYWVAAHAILDFKFFIDGTEVLFARHNRSAQYDESRYAFEWPIMVGGTTDVNMGRHSTWTQPKTLYMQVRHYGGSNYGNLNGTYYWDGGASNQFNIPLVGIEAIY
jgi:hypothetical protein